VNVFISYNTASSVTVLFSIDTFFECCYFRLQ